MSIQFFHPDFSAVFSDPSELSFKGKTATELKRVATHVPSSNELSGIELRLLPPFVIDNNTTPVFPFPGFAKVYVLTIVVSDADNQVVGGIDLQGFPRIGDKEHLPVNKTIFYWQHSVKSAQPPSQVHVFCSVLKSKSGLRKAGEVMTDLQKDAEYKSVLKTIAGLSSGGVGVALNLISQVAGIVGKYLGQVEDKPLGTVVNSYTALRGDFDITGVNRKTYPTKKINFELELVVRDSERTEGGKKAAEAGARGMRGGGEEAMTDTGEEVFVEMIRME